MLTHTNQRDRDEINKETRALSLYLDTLHVDLNDAVLRGSLDLLLEFQSTLTSQLQGWVISLIDILGNGGGGGGIGANTGGGVSTGSGVGTGGGMASARGVSSSRDGSFLVSSSYVGASNNNSFLRGSTESLRGSKSLANTPKRHHTNPNLTMN